jgi:hypothetical protein
MFVVIKTREQFSSYIAEIVYNNLILYTTPAYSIRDLAIHDADDWFRELKRANVRIEQNRSANART